MNSPRLFAVLTNCICKQEIRSKATWEEEGEKQEQAGGHGEGRLIRTIYKDIYVWKSPHEAIVLCAN